MDVYMYMCTECNGVESHLKQFYEIIGLPYIVHSELRCFNLLLCHVYIYMYLYMIT